MTEYFWTIVIACVLLYAAVSGFAKGLLSQIGQIAGLITGVLASRAFAPSLMAMLGKDAGVGASSVAATAVCYVLVFFATYFAVVFLAKIVRLVVKVACLGPIDRISGAVFKVVKWTLIISLIYNLSVAVGLSAAPGSTSNPLERIVYGAAPAVLDMWPASTSTHPIALIQ